MQGSNGGETSLATWELARAIEKVEARERAAAPSSRRPVHVLYGGAHRFDRNAAPKLGRIALAAFEAHARDVEAFLANVFDDTDAADARVTLEAATLHALVRRKLEREPIEDLRIDFEDGFGPRPDVEEDEHAKRTAAELAEAHRMGALPPFVGVRIRSLGGPTRERALRTLDLFATSLARAGAVWPSGFAITLPKTTYVDEVELLAEALSLLERKLGFPERSAAIELLFETPPMIVDEAGAIAARRFAAACDDRCRAFHFGPYDYTSSLGIAGKSQGLDHPASKLARRLVQVALGGTGIALYDGPTSFLPTPARRAPAEETDDSRASDLALIRRAYALHAKNVRRVAEDGLDGSWDLHPTQLVPRYSSLFRYYREDFEEAAGRLRRFLDQAATAIRDGAVFDDAATALGLVEHLRRGLASGALTEDEIERAVGLPTSRLFAGSFADLVTTRRAAVPSTEA